MESLISASRRTRRRYRVLRIPKQVVERYLTKRAGRSVEVEIPERAERRRRSSRWEHRAILDLAKAAVQNECKDRNILRRVADRARLLTLVPESLWSEIEWYDCEEEE